MIDVPVAVDVVRTQCVVQPGLPEKIRRQWPVAGHKSCWVSGGRRCRAIVRGPLGANWPLKLKPRLRRGAAKAAGFL
jgi:hypothetical protein